MDEKPYVNLATGDRVSADIGESGGCLYVPRTPVAGRNVLFELIEAEAAAAFCESSVHNSWFLRLRDTPSYFFTKFDSRITDITVRETYSFLQEWRQAKQA